jgi:hypothetical protein
MCSSCVHTVDRVPGVISLRALYFAAHINKASGRVSMAVTRLASTKTCTDCHGTMLRIRGAPSRDPDQKQVIRTKVLQDFPQSLYANARREHSLKTGNTCLLLCYLKNNYFHMTLYNTCIREVIIK